MQPPSSNYKYATVDVAIKTPPIGVRVDQVLHKCIAPTLNQRDYLVLYKFIDINWDWENKLKYYRFQFRVSAVDHDVSQTEAEGVIRAKIKPWFDK